MERAFQAATQDFRGPSADNVSCSFPLKHHPKEEDLLALIRPWLQESLLIGAGALSVRKQKRLVDIRYDLLACIFWPNGRSLRSSLTMLKLMYWYFSVDDVVDDAKLGMGQDAQAAHAFCASLLEGVFGAEVAEAEGWVAAGECVSGVEAQEELRFLVDVGRECWSELLRVGMPPSHHRRAVHVTSCFLKGALEFVRLREQQSLPNLEDYILLRRLEGGMVPMSTLCEFTIGIELDHATLSHPLVQAFHEAAWDHLLWINDVFSFKKECLDGDHINLIGVLYFNHMQAVDGGPTNHEKDRFEHAIAQAYSMIHARDQDCVRLAREIAAWQPHLQPYLDATCCMTSAMLDWCRSDDRYNGTRELADPGVDSPSTLP